MTPLYQPPVASTSFAGDADFCYPVLRFQYYRDDVLVRSGIRFEMITATRMRTERCCTVWHIEAYDTLVSVEGSAWLKEIVADTHEPWRHKWKMNHYMIYLDSTGCFEFIAESWKVLPEEVGAWPGI
jgi:hypothetical protein